MKFSVYFFPFCAWHYDSVLTKERDFRDKLQHHGGIAFPLIEPMLFIEKRRTDLTG